MNIKVNPMLDFSRADEVVLKKSYTLCEELVMALSSYTLTDDACITCADNGEVFVTEKELYEVLDIIGRMERIVHDAPKDYDNDCRKLLAVRFEN